MISSEDIKVSQGDSVDSSDKVTHGGVDMGTSLDLIGNEEIRAYTELENGAQESDVDVRGSDGDVDVAENIRSDEIRVSEIDHGGINEEMESRVCEIKNEDVAPRGSDNIFSDRKGGAEHLGSSVGGNGLSSGERGLVEVSDHRFDLWNGGMENLGSRSGKGHLEVGKSGESQYNSMLSMFDEFAVNGRGNAVGEGPLTPLWYGYEIGDMVWGKVKSHPWWPGHIYNEAFASSSVRRIKREGHVLVAFFGDSSYGWFDTAELVPFDPNYAEKLRQTNSRTFVKAVEEAVDEASRRCGLGLACRCRNPLNFRPTNLQGFFSVHVGDYEPGGVYSVNQIKKARDSFQPRETLTFIKQLALMPTIDEQPSIDFIKNKATVFAYRKAVFEEFDETYAQAFGMQPVRPSREPTEAVAQSVPLSGPLVIAEPLGKGKISTKSNRAKDQAKKDRYLFKRRDELDELKRHQTNLGHASSSTQPNYVEGSLAITAGDFVLQKRAPGVSIKPQIPAKHEHTGTISRDAASASSQDVTGKEAANSEDKPAVGKFSMTASQMNTSKVESPASFATSIPVGQTPADCSYLLEAKCSLDKGKHTLLEMKESTGSDAAAGPADVGISSLLGKGVLPGVLDNVPRTFEPEGEVTIDLKHDTQNATKFKLVQSPSLPVKVEELHGQGQVLDGHKEAKKAKVLKRALGESKQPFKKKKRKKEMGMSSDHMQKRTATGKSGTLLGKVAGKSVQVDWGPREDFQVNRQKKDDACSSLLPDSVGAQQKDGIGKIEFELPQLLSDLQALALNPFHGVERNSPVVIQQVILRFRSLVYQKSLSLSQVVEPESNEARSTKYPAGTAVSDITLGENIKDLPALRPAKPLVRSDDPTKGGRKRVASDRQEEMAAKRLKKINDLKTLTAEKKAAQKTPEAPRGDGKETVAPTPPKPVRVDPAKKMEPPGKARDPMMLVMKFPPQTNLPSASELKARLARFGPLDHSGTRIFWKSSTCRVVFLHKHDAHAAHRHLTGNNSLFGNVNVRCHLRELGVQASESESGKVRTEDACVETPQLRDSGVEQRPPLQQQTVQLKSILKKSSGDETGGGNGGGSRGPPPRVKFMLVGEESSRVEQLMVGNKNNFNNNNNNATSFADGGASSSSSPHGMDFNSKNFQKVIPPLPLPTLPSAQFPKAPSNLQYTEVTAPRNTHNFNTSVTQSMPNIDIAQQMLSLLTRCNDVVTNVKSFLGYVPYHPL
uniref:PWWP domain-containing protein n=1 Tax=Davidia involucrata TaxID=16924 RepID=A0A5B6YU47_DAVIN